MILTLSILAGLLSACLWYHVLFYDSSDFRQGCGKFAAGLGKRRQKAIWEQTDFQPTPERFEDEGWSGGIRFLVFLAASFGCGYLVYYELHKHLS